MSQIPRRTTLSMTQQPKARKTPSYSPAASQPVISLARISGPDGDSPRTTPKTIDVDTPIVIEDHDFGDSVENNDLIQVLSSVEEKNGLSNKSLRVEEKPKESPAPVSSPTTGKAGKEPSKRSKAKKSTSDADSVSNATTDDNQSCSTSIRSSVDSSSCPPVEMESLLIPEDDEVVVANTEKNGTTYDSPRPNKTPGKVVRLAKGLRISPFRRVDSQQLDNVSTIVNLSTVSEQSVENNLDSPVVTAEPSAPADTASTPEDNGGVADAGESSTRRISARRTFATNRPLREMSFRNATREAYKKNGNGTSEENSNEAVNDSVNATVGSELGFNMDDLPETPAAGQKRRRDSSDGEDESSSAPEPKKSLFQTYCAIM